MISWYLTGLRLVQDEQAIPLPRTGLVMIVGPNNAGKTTLLREVYDALSFDETRNGHAHSSKRKIVSAVDCSEAPSDAELSSWLAANFPSDATNFFCPTEGEEPYSMPRPPAWPIPTVFLVRHVDSRQALNMVQPQDVHDFVARKSPRSLLGALAEDSASMRACQKAFSDAFDEDLLLSQGSAFRLHIGKQPPIPAGEHERSLAYQRLLGDLPTIEQQGSGTRSFCASLLLARVAPQPVLLMDEPELSLAAPQARRVGRELAEAGQRRQILAATHSAEILRGALEAGRKNLTVIRVTREGTRNRLHELDANKINKLWGTAALRYTNALEGVFHGRVVVTEDDTDSRFYDWVSFSDDRDDVQFTATSGKQNLVKVAEPLRAIGVDVRVVADFDMLRDKKQLATLLTGLGADWSNLESSWDDIMKRLGVERRTSVQEVRQELVKYLDSLGPEDEINNTRVAKILEEARPFGAAKHQGLGALSERGDREEVKAFLQRLAACRLFLVPSGQLESFVPALRSNTKKGARWLLAVHERYSRPAHADLAEAREFMATVLGDVPEVSRSQQES